MRPRGEIVSVLLAVLPSSAAGWPPSAETQQTAVAEQAPMSTRERRLEDRIYVRLAERAWVGADFDARVNQGIVTVSGTVPSEQTRQGILRVVRRTRGVSEVRDQLRVDPAVGRDRGGSPVPDAELARRVAHTIAGTLAGAKAGQDWWFTGWRVEGPYQSWTMVVDAVDGEVTLDGEVPSGSTIRTAVQAALQVPGVLSVRSEIEIESILHGSPLYYWWHPYDVAPGYPDAS
jgi:hypothetical protein